MNAKDSRPGGMMNMKFTKEDLSGEGKIVKKGKKSFNRIIAK
jgi:hypothetical protein